MTTPTEPMMPAGGDDDDESRLFALLDRYVELLHAQNVDSRSAVIARHPELAGLLECLESLDSLAPTVAENPVGDTERDEDEVPTVRASDSAVVAEPAEPTPFGKYQLLGELGRGGMGVVYAARQTDLDRTVALKMILSSHLATSEEVERFYAEARAAGRLKHPNIVAIHEVGEIMGQHYFAMDCVEGTSLAEELRKKSISLEQSVRCLAAVARAVHYLHEHGVVHRDLKPSNILLDQAGNPYVTDFGLAKVFDIDTGRTGSGMIIGTPGFMSPEQAAGRIDEISPRSDIYSLGAILYLMLTGQAPFGHTHPMYTLLGAVEGDPPLPRSLNPEAPRDLQAICLRCLERDPGDRYHSAADLAADLERFQSGEPVEARATGIGQRFRRWLRREPALASRWAALAAAAGIVQLKYMHSGYDWPFHVKVMSILGIWGIVAFLFQKLHHRTEHVGPTRMAWTAADALLLTVLLCIVDGPVGPLLVAYPLLIAAAGLFSRARLVWFTTFACLVSYSALVYVGVEPADPPHYPIIFAAALVVVGFIVSYQVERLRILSRYCERRRDT